MSVTIAGAGLAGCEAAWQCAENGIKVKLCEMKPLKFTPAHKNPDFAELICSNSLKAARIDSAAGLMKEEMRRLGSLLLRVADECSVPAGGALAVDRNIFAAKVTQAIRSHPNIEVIETELTAIPQDDVVIIATGPLTSEPLSKAIGELCGNEFLNFHDAAAPIVTAESIDMRCAFAASRYDKGGDDYINCPMNKEEYIAFRNALVTAERAEVKNFDKEIVFEGCMPIETMASRGEDTMRYGPLKPVGLIDPRTGEEPYACLQLRQDNRAKTMYNLVGFQTRLKFGEQKRVFGMIPGLENAEYYRMGVMHRNTYLNSPENLTPRYSLRKMPNIHFAGQITGVEGYIESTASGLLAGFYAATEALGIDCPMYPDADTVIGSMAMYVSDPNVKKFVPMNANFGIVNPIPGKFRGKTAKKDKNSALAARSLEQIDRFAGTIEEIRQKTGS